MGEKDHLKIKIGNRLIGSRGTGISDRGNVSESCGEY